MIRTTVLGFYPKVTDDAGVPSYRTARNRLDQGRIGADEFRRVVAANVARVVREQEDAGIDLPTDGQLEWDDLVTPFARAWTGTAVGGLIRFFDNNVYYRRAQIRGPLAAAKTVAAGDFRRAAAVASRPLKGVLPGPLSFGQMADDHHYGDRKQVVLALAGALHSEARALEEAGCRDLQIDEPYLALCPSDSGLLGEALEVMLKGIHMRTTLAVYFHSLEPLVPMLWKLPVDGFFLDCVSRPENFERALQAPADRPVVFGISDARNTGREAPAFLDEALERIATRRPEAENWVALNAQLEFLPHSDLGLKLRDLAAAVRRRNERSAGG